ncbi:MAG: hypothetical protein ACSW8D_08270 [Prevotella sp.]
MIQVNNNSGGTVIISDQPSKPKRWIKKWHAFGLFFAVSNGRIKKRDERYYEGGYRDYTEKRKAVFEQHATAVACAARRSEAIKTWRLTIRCRYAGFPN